MRQIGLDRLNPATVVPQCLARIAVLVLASARKAAARQSLCSDIGGFSLHAGVRVEAHDSRLLEQLCRYITRPVLFGKRVQRNAADQVKLKLKTSWRDGARHLLMSPLEFMPRPRLLLIRFDGVLAPNAKLRALVAWT